MLYRGLYGSLLSSPLLLVSLPSPPLLPLLPSPSSVAPTITQPPTSLAVKEGSLAQLQCLGAGLPPPVVTWWKSMEDVSMATQVQPSSGTVIGSEYLVILRASVLDVGYYYCNLSSPVGVVTSPQALLNVYSKSYDITQLTSLNFYPFNCSGVLAFTERGQDGAGDHQCLPPLPRLQQPPSHHHLVLPTRHALHVRHIHHRPQRKPYCAQREPP